MRPLEVHPNPVASLMMTQLKNSNQNCCDSATKETNLLVLLHKALNPLTTIKEIPGRKSGHQRREEGTAVLGHAKSAFTLCSLPRDKAAQHRSNKAASQDRLLPAASTHLPGARQHFYCSRAQGPTPLAEGATPPAEPARGAGGAARRAAKAAAR